MIAGVNLISLCRETCILNNRIPGSRASEKYNLLIGLKEKKTKKEGKKQ